MDQSPVQLSFEIAICATQAHADFSEVVAGRTPIHALPDENTPIPSDGGTAFFAAPGYTLTVVKALTCQGGVDGYTYGPVITFDETAATGHARTISQVNFYEHDVMLALLRRGIS